MKLHLFWVDKMWKKRGYAKNFNLLIDTENKTYKVFENPYFDYKKTEDIEVKKKSDIIDYIEYLKDNGFTKEQKEKYTMQ